MRYDAAGVARLDRLYSTPQIVEQRRRLRALLAARPGEVGLDVGCGAGHLACELAREVAPGGGIFAVDSSADSIAACRARASRETVGEIVRAEAGDAATLSFRDASFDFIAVSQVYCYVKDVAGALSEAARVLKPGGRLVVLESDWDFCAWRSPDRALTRRIVLARAAAMYEHAHLPRELGALFAAAGLALARAEAFAIVETSYDPESFGAGTLEGTRREAIKHGSVSPEVVTAWEAEIRSRAQTGDWFFCLNRFMFEGRK